jgi:hypothetical protein
LQDYNKKLTLKLELHNNKNFNFNINLIGYIHFFVSSMRITPGMTEQYIFCINDINLKVLSKMKPKSGAAHD